jgi:hypothetical protein
MKVFWREGGGRQKTNSGQQNRGYAPGCHKPAGAYVTNNSFPNTWERILNRMFRKTPRLWSMQSRKPSSPLPRRGIQPPFRAPRWNKAPLLCMPNSLTPMTLRPARRRLYRPRRLLDVLHDPSRAVLRIRPLWYECWNRLRHRPSLEVKRRVCLAVNRLQCARISDAARQVQNNIQVRTVLSLS